MFKQGGETATAVEVQPLLHCDTVATEQGGGDWIVLACPVLSR
jgi:hypothetical protein